MLLLRSSVSRSAADGECFLPVWRKSGPMWLQRPLSQGLWHQLSRFTRRRKQAPQFCCNMNQHLAAGPAPSFHYFRPQNELLGLRTLKRQRRMVGPSRAPQKHPTSPGCSGASLELWKKPAPQICYGHWDALADDVRKAASRKNLHWQTASKQRASFLTPRRKSARWALPLPSCIFCLGIGFWQAAEWSLSQG